jgi:hypothetical protein
MLTSTRRAARTLAIAAALLTLAGCKTAGQPTTPAALEAAPALKSPRPGPYEVTIEFDAGGCPKNLLVAKEDQCDPAPPKDAAKCLQVAEAGTRTVAYRRVGADGFDEIEFSLDFTTSDPFEQPAKGVKLRKAAKHTAKIKAGSPKNTYFTYSVTRPDCTPQDPQIIVRD